MDFIHSARSAAARKLTDVLTRKCFIVGALLAALTVYLAYSTPLVLVAGVALWFYNPIHINKKAEKVAEDYLLEVAEEPNGGQALVEEPECKPKNCQRLAVDHARAELGTVKDNAANRLVVSRVIRNFMVERGMRKTHVAYYFPVAVELYFIPTDQDVFAAEVRRTQAVREAHARLNDGSPVW